MGHICTASNGHLQNLLPRWAGGQVAEDASPKAAQAGLIQVLQHHRNTQLGCTATDDYWSHFNTEKSWPSAGFCSSRGL